MKDDSLEVERQQQQADREYSDTFRSFKSNHKKKVNNLCPPINTETADWQAKQTSPEGSESAESSESENTRTQMEMTLSSVRSKRGKQSAVKARSPAKRKRTSKKQPLKETPSKKAVQVISEFSGTDPEDKQMLASLQEKKTKQKAMKGAAQKKDTSNVAKKQS